MILHVTRHGQVLPSSHELAPPNPHRDDPRLSALGRDQAERTGRKLQETGFAGLIYTSPYRRAAETAVLIAEASGTTTVLAPPLREMVAKEGQMDDFGGGTPETLCEELPGLAYPSNVTHPWWTFDLETIDDVVARTALFVSEIEQAGTDALLVGHGATANASIRTVLSKYDPSQVGSQGVTWNCALSSFRLTPEFETLLLADVSHLPPEAVTSNAASHERAEVLREMNYL